MSKSLSSYILFGLLAASFVYDAAAQTSVTGRIVQTDVAAGQNYGFRVYIGSVGAHCTGGPNWAFVNENDSNYKTFVTTLLLAKVSGSNVSIWSTNVGGYCQIYYIATSN